MTHTHSPHPQAVGPQFSLAKMQQARDLTFDAIHRIAAQIRPGMTERQAKAVARRYAENPPIALAMIKASIVSGGSTLAECLDNEVAFQPLLMQTKDHAEAVAAFLAKRKPVFTGE